MGHFTLAGSFFLGYVVPQVRASKSKKKRSKKAVVSVHGLPSPKVIISLSSALTFNGWHRPMESNKVHWKCSMKILAEFRWEVIFYYVAKKLLWSAPGYQSQIKHPVLQTGEVQNTIDMGFLRLLPRHYILFGIFQRFQCVISFQYHKYFF